MANTGFKGLDARQSGTAILFRAFLQDSAGAIVTAGTTNLYIYELQSDGTIKSYDFNDNTFKTTALSTEVQALTHRTGNNSTTNTGYWTYALTTLTGFTVGAVYVARVKNTGASPTDQMREFVYGGSADGDMVAQTGDSFAVVKSGGTGDAAAIKTKTDFLPSATAGAAGGVFIAGSNAATTISGLTTGALSCTTITASGAVAFQSTFAVTTSTSLAALSCTTLTASGAVAFQSTFAITTSTSLAALSATTITASGTTSLAAVTTSGTVTFNAFTVTNATTLNITGNLSGSVGSVTGAVGSVTGAVGSVTAAITLPAIPANWITAAGINSGALVAAVWDGSTTSHTTGGTFGGSLNAAASAGDPWATDLPGSYGTGTAGYILGTNLDIAVSSRSDATVVDIVDGVFDEAAAAHTGILTNLDATVSSRSTLTQTDVTGGAYSVQDASCVLGDARIAHLNADVTSRMATYTQPTGFLAATFPTTVASTTNITAGTITTATNLTNAPTAGDFTATMKTSLNAATPAVTVSDKTGFKLASDGVAAISAWTVAITGNVTGNLSGSVGSVTGNVGGNVTGSVGSISGVSFPTHFSSMSITVGGAVLVDGTSPLTEDYTTGAFTLAQGLYEISQTVGELSKSGTTLTAKKRDALTTAATWTLDSSSTPTSRTRAS